METISEIFEVTISRKRTVKKMVKGAWVKVGTNEVERDSRFRDNDDPRTRLDDKFDYAPDREAFVDETEQIYTQKVEKFDLASVIKAVNALP